MVRSPPRSALARAAASRGGPAMRVRSGIVLGRAKAYATEAAPVKPRKSFVRRLLVPTVLMTGAVYGGGTYLALENDSFHNVFVERVPLAENLVSYFEENKLERLSDYSHRGTSSTPTTARESPTAMTRDLKAEKDRLAKKGAENRAKLLEKSEQSGQRAKQEVKKGGQEVKKGDQKVEQQAKTVKQEVVAKVEKAKEGADDLVKRAEAALGISSSSSSSKDLAPRQLDASPQPVPKQNLPPFEGTIPLGFEAPPGYSGSAPRPRLPTTDKPQAPPPPPPLPLVAPSVRDLSASEPVLGQLASTIDALAGFLRDFPGATDKSSSSGHGSAKAVLTTAELDLKNLGARLDKIKTEERRALEEKLDEQAKKYSSLLLQAERDLHDRLDRQETDWKTAFDSERTALVHAYKKKLEGELETQQEIINARLKEEVVKQGIEMQRRWVREVKLRVEQERGGRLAKLEELEGGLKKLERVTMDNDEYLDENLRVHRLWSALRAASAVVSSGARVPLTEQVRALYAAARKPAPAPPSSDEGSEPASAAQPDVIATALDTIDPSTVQSGIASTATLTRWFSDSLAPRVKSAALLPEQAGVLSYFASWLFSFLLFTDPGFVEGRDVPSVLSRAGAYLRRNDVDSAAREVNQLKGWPKILARDWLEAARRHLEVKQALELAETEAKLESILL